MQQSDHVMQRTVTRLTLDACSTKHFTFVVIVMSYVVMCVLIIFIYTCSYYVALQYVCYVASYV